MAEKEFNNQDTRAPQVPPLIRKKQSRSLWIILLIFFVFVITVFLTEHKEDTVNWKDYEAGIKLAEQQHKPILLAFYKLYTRYTMDTLQNTYNNPEVIEYVEANFVPILIDVDKQPEIAERYKVDYYPTYYIKRPDSDELFGPMLGYYPPASFIEKLKDLLKKMELSGK